MRTQLLRPLGLALATVALTALSSMARANDFGGPSQSGTEDPSQEPPPCESGKPCQCPAPGRSDSPISYWTGSESLTRTDLVVRGQFPIVITRKYDSQSDFDSPLGYGWVFLHERRLYEYPDGSVVLRHGCGDRDRFVFSGGTYVTPAGGVLGTLIENPDGSFQLTYNNGDRDFFDNQGRLTAAHDSQGNRHEYSYDSRGKLPLTGTSKAAVDPTAPMVVALNYRLTRIDERAANGTLTGRYVTFQYNETTGRLTTVTANDGRSVSYQHDVAAGLTKGNLIQVNGLDGIVSTYGYTDPYDAHNLTSITKAAGRTPIVNTYDDQDRVIRQEEGTRKIEFTYQIPLTKTVVTKTIKDQNGLNPYTAVTTYDFESSGRITKMTDALGHETRYTYDSTKAMRRKEIWQKDGGNLTLLQAVDWTYDTAGHKVSEVVALDSGETITRSWTYDHDRVASEQVVSSAAPSKLFRTEYTFYYGTDGRPTNIKDEKRRKDDGNFQTTTFTYDGRNRLLTTTLPDGVKIVNEYTGDYVTKTYFEVSSVEIPQLTRRFEYDSEGNRIKEWDARNNLTQYGFDDLGRTTSITNPLGEQTLYSYTDDLLTQIEVGHTAADGEGQVTKLNYDARGRVTSIQRKDDSGTFQTYETYELDSEGQRLSVSDALSRKTQFAYDLLGRAISATDPLNKVTQFGYDAADNRTSVTDALGRQVKYEFDDLNRQTAIVEMGVSPNPRTENSYDAAANLVSVKDAENHTTTYEFDALSRNTKVTQPLGQFVQYAYDNRGRVDFLVNARGNKVDFGYETWGPLKEEKHYATTSSSTPTRTISYTRDHDGNVLSVTDDAVQAGPTYAMSYDSLSRPYDETVKYLPGGDRVLNHRYDRFGNRKELTLQDGTNLVHTYTYNKLNRLSAASLAGASISLGHYANDDRQSIALPNGVTELFTYKANGPVQDITVTGPSGPITQFAYAYDDVLNVDTQTDLYGVHDFGYDGLNRLTSVVRPGGSGLPNESYTHDKVGNREVPGNPSQYAYDNNNRITASPGVTYTFDDDGNLLTRGDGASYTHDYRNRLVQFSKGATSATYLYDADGRRIRKTVNGMSTWYLWAGAQLLAEYSGSGGRQQRYAYLEDDHVPTQLEDLNGVYYVHSDHLQTPRLLTGSSVQVVWRSRHEGFGKAIVETDPDGNSVHVTVNMRFPGQYSDAESDGHYNLLRDYDPRAGRYVQYDPLGLIAGPNAFSYADGNPLKLIDPDGRQRQTININQYNNRYPTRWNDWRNQPPRNLPTDRVPPPRWFQERREHWKDFNQRLADHFDDLAKKEKDRQRREQWEDLAEDLRENPPPPPPEPPQQCTKDDYLLDEFYRQVRRRCMGTREQCVIRDAFDWWTMIGRWD